MAFWTYILLCADGLYYTGHTDNLEYRIGQHQSGQIRGDWKAMSHFAKPPKERPPSPFASSEVEMPRGYAPTMGVSTSLDTNGHGAPAENGRGDT